MSDATFTQEQVNEQIATAKTQWETDVLNPIVSERDELLQFKPKELTDEEKELQTKQQELFTKEVSLELKSAGLEKFADFFNVEKVEDLQPQIQKFQGLLNELKVEMGYKPDNRRQQDKYSQFEKDKNTTGMIGSKLASLFK